MTRILHPHFVRGIGGIGALGGAAYNIPRVLGSDEDEWVINCGSSGGPQRCGLLSGRTVKSINRHHVYSGACSEGTGWKWDKEGHAIVVDGGCNAEIRVVYEPKRGAGKDYASAEREIRSMIDEINSCEISWLSEAPAPLILSAPGSDASEAEKAAYDSYAFTLNSDLPDAKRDAAIPGMCASFPKVPPPGGQASPDPAEDPSAGGGTFTIPSPSPGSDPYGDGGGIYNPSPGTAWSAGGTVIQDPFNPPPVQAVEIDQGMSSRSKVGIGIGGLAAIGILIWVGSKRRKRRKSRALFAGSSR